MCLLHAGGSLDQYGQIPELILGRIAVSVVRGMQYLWSLKIMHRGNNLYLRRYFLMTFMLLN